MASKVSYNVRALDRAIRILDMLAEGKSLKLNQLSQLLGMSDSTTYRILETLTNHRYATHNERKRGYSLGIRCLGSTVGSAMELLRGRVGVYINWQGAKIWDIAAAALAVEEAGGVALSSLGHALTWEQLEMSAMLAANARLASEAYSCNDKAFSRTR